MMKFNSNLLAALALIIALIFWLVIENTYDMGDSITHYAISHFSWKHSYLFFDNWGKPVFTIISSPFAQAGWEGITLFNTLVGVLTCILLAQIIKKLEWKISPYAALLLFFIPNYPLILNSGLTEPLYAFILVAGIYFFVCEKYNWCAMIMSLLPFVRSEGYISIAVFVFALAIMKQWRSIPLFLVGFLMITILGYLFVYDHILWLFQTNPYTSDHGYNNYGAGTWSDYFIKFYYMTGIPFTILFWSAVCILVVVLLMKLKHSIFQLFTSIEFILLGLFFSFFLAHVVFWKFGIFHSFGMSRVLISILPVGLLMVLYMLHLIYSSRLKGVVVAACVLLLAFPFFDNNSAWKFSKEFSMDPEMKAMKEIPLAFNLDSLQATEIYYSSVPLMTIWNYDVYDTTKMKSIKQLQTQKSTSVRYAVVMEDWFMNVDCNIKRDDSLFVGLKKVYSKKVSDINTVDIYINE